MVDIPANKSEFLWEHIYMFKKPNYTFYTTFLR